MNIVISRCLLISLCQIEFNLFFFWVNWNHILRSKEATFIKDQNEHDNTEQRHQINEHIDVSPNHYYQSNNTKISHLIFSIIFFILGPIESVLAPKDSVPVDEPGNLEGIQEDECEKVAGSLDLPRITHVAPHEDQGDAPQEDYYVEAAVYVGPWHYFLLQLVV